MVNYIVVHVNYNYYHTAFNRLYEIISRDKIIISYLSPIIIL